MIGNIMNLKQWFLSGDDFVSSQEHLVISEDIFSYKTWACGEDYHLVGKGQRCC